MRPYKEINLKKPVRKELHRGDPIEVVAIRALGRILRHIQKNGFDREAAIKRWQDEIEDIDELALKDVSDKVSNLIEEFKQSDLPKKEWDDIFFVIERCELEAAMYGETPDRKDFDDNEFLDNQVHTFATDLRYRPEQIAVANILKTIDWVQRSYKVGDQAVHFMDAALILKGAAERRELNGEPISHLTASMMRQLLVEVVIGAAWEDNLDEAKEALKTLLEKFETHTVQEEAFPQIEIVKALRGNEDVLEEATDGHAKEFDLLFDWCESIDEGESEKLEAIERNTDFVDLFMGAVQEALDELGYSADTLYDAANMAVELSEQDEAAYENLKHEAKKSLGKTLESDTKEEAIDDVYDKFGVEKADDEEELCQESPNEMAIESNAPEADFNEKKIPKGIDDEKVKPHIDQKEVKKAIEFLDKRGLIDESDASFNNTQQENSMEQEGSDFLDQVTDAIKEGAGQSLMGKASGMVIEKTREAFDKGDPIRQFLESATGEEVTKVAVALGLWWASEEWPKRVPLSDQAAWICKLMVRDSVSNLTSEHFDRIRDNLFPKFRELAHNLEQLADQLPEDMDREEIAEQVVLGEIDLEQIAESQQKPAKARSGG